MGAVFKITMKWCIQKTAASEQMSVSEPVKTVLVLLWLLVFNFLPAAIKRFKLYGK